MTRHKVITPHGGMVIWNYEERITADSTKDPHKIEKVYIASKYIVSMSTSKSKSNPVGSFEVRLAPTINWVGKITPGSWCTILMSRDVPITKETGLEKADRKTVKMLGRIKDVRVAIGIDQTTGARRTEYVVTGDDWGSVFNSTLYVDPVARDPSPDRQMNSIGQAERIIYDQIMINAYSKKAGFPSSSQNITSIIKLWGAPLAKVQPSIKSATSGLSVPILSAKSQYKLPSEVAQYFNFGGEATSILSSLTGSVTSVNFADLITQYDGVLKSYDNYSGDNDEAFSYIDPSSVFGLHTFWQLLVDNSNPTINELVTDLRWEDEKPVLALYKRVRPFLLRENFDGSTEDEVVKNISRFKDVRRVKVDIEDVMSINAGTNLNEKINFIEIKPYDSLLKQNYEVDVKHKSQAYDFNAYERDGFKPLILKPHSLPYNSSGVAPLKATEWKYLLREWHFSKDTMLNGGVTFIGLDDYIQVGDNIMINAAILGASFNAPQSSLGDKESFLTAHVEQIEHQFSINEATGARNFLTTVRFVRGVITDENGQSLSNSESALNKNSSQSTDDDLNNANTMFKSSRPTHTSEEY